MSILRVVIVAAGAGMTACGGATDTTTPPVTKPGTYSVSGKIVGTVQSSVLLRAHGETEPAAFSDPTGNYKLEGVDNGTYTLVPYPIGFAYTFSPESRTIVVAGASLVDQNFSATAPATCAAPFAIGPLVPGIGTTYYIVATDFNGDGKLDIATTAEGHDSLSVYLGNGDGTFRTRADFATGRDARGITAGDFNGDGKVDLAVAISTFSSAVAADVLLGRGDGTFGAATTYSIGPGGINAIASADLNGDGRIDLVVAKLTALSVLTGRGDGTFNASVDYRTGTFGRGVAIADLNADGKLDLVGTDNDVSSTVAVLLGNGDATFATAVAYPVARNSISVVALDVNGDGKADLVTSAGSVLLGNGNGTFQTKTDFDPSEVGWQIAVGDFNNDAKVDLVVASGRVGLLFGKGNGTFQRVVLFDTFQTNSLVVGDFNRDGKPDVAIAAGTPLGPSGFRLLRNTCF